MIPDERRRRAAGSAAAAGSGGWSVLELDVPAGLADEVAGRMAALILGAEHRPAGPGLTRIRLFLRSPRGTAAAGRLARRVLRGFGLDPDACGLRSDRIEDDHWVERYRAALRPMPLGRRFTVLPGGSGAAPPGREAILLAPGRAFGTGEHATTRLCAGQLERRVRDGSRWVDLGCGTGILSIVARRCGAREVLAVDEDPEAVAVAAEVLAANGLAGQVDLGLGSIERAGGPGWSGIVANIHASFFLARGAALRDALEPGGLLVASGFTVEEADEISAALRAAGLVEVERRADGPWAAWVGRRGTGGGGA